MTGNQHKDVMRAIRNMEAAWEKTCERKFALTSRTVIQPNGGTREEIRTMTDEQGEPWFVGKDVAEALGYSNAQKAVRNHVDEEDKGVNEMGTPGGKQPSEKLNK